MAKIGIVKVSELKPGLDLRASTYLDSTRHLDKAIGRANATIVNAQKRLRVLTAERDRILTGSPPLLQLDARGHLRRCDWMEPDDG